MSTIYGDFGIVSPPATTTVQVTFNGRLTSPHSAPPMMDGSLWIVQGDSYMAQHDRAITFKITELPPGAVCYFELTTNVDGTIPLPSVGCSIIPLPLEANQVKITCELTRDQTSKLYTGDDAYTYRLRAALVDGAIVTLLAGSVSVTDGGGQ